MANIKHNMYGTPIYRSNLANKIYINKMDILEAIDYLIIKKRGV